MRIMPAFPTTVSEALRNAAACRASERALGYIRDGQLHWRTWQDLVDEASRLAALLSDVGLEPGDRVAQVSENRYEWIITDLAIHLAGLVHVPIHVTLSPEQIAEQIIDSGSRLVFVSKRDLLNQLTAHLPPNSVCSVYGDHDTRNIGAELKLRKDLPPAPGPEPSASNPQRPAPTSLATILYTSGTTGRPRGVMLTHDNLTSNAAAVVDAFDRGEEDTRLCVLPLSHIYARTCDLYTWIFSASRLVLAESRETLARDLQIAKPNAINAVPFLYQRIADRIREAGGDERIALRNFFGCQVDMLNCGGAPLAPDVEAWYADHGMPILIGYGLTETSPVVSISTPQAHRCGAVGKLLRDIEVRIADDGEILVRGPNIMHGLWRNEEATAQMIIGGWFHTGDLGALDSDGFLFIRGRKKELIVLSTGKKVVPTRVELLLATSPLIDQAAVFGDGHCGLVALLVPSANGAPAGESHEAKHTRYQAEVTRCLATAAHEEQVHYFHIIDRPFSIEHGEMTGKLSLRRAVIAQNFAAELARLTSQHH